MCTKNLPTDLARMDLHKTNMHQQKHPFCGKKTTWLPHVCYTCGPLWTKKTTWLPPFVLKKRTMGCLGVSSCPPLSTTKRSAIKSVFWGVKTFHCSRLLPSLCCNVPLYSCSVAAAPLPPPPALCLFVRFLVLNAWSAPYSPPPPPPPGCTTCTYLCHISSPRTATSCGQYV